MLRYMLGRAAWRLVNLLVLSLLLFALLSLVPNYSLMILG